MTVIAFPPSPPGPAFASDLFLVPGKRPRKSRTERPKVTGVMQRALSETASPRTLSVADEAFNDFRQQALALQKRMQKDTPRDIVAPTMFAYQAAFVLLEAAQKSGILIAGDLYPEGEGGLCVDWERGEKKVELLLHASEQRENYAYFETRTKYGIKTPLTPEILIERLQWLLQDGE